MDKKEKGNKLSCKELWKKKKRFNTMLDHTYSEWTQCSIYIRRTRKKTYTFKL